MLKYIGLSGRELHADGDDGIGVRLYDGHFGNGGEGDSIHVSRQ